MAVGRIEGVAVVTGIFLYENGLAFRRDKKKVAVITR